MLGEPGTGGSSTPSMVGSVRKWQNSDPTTSQEIWQKLAESNSLLELQLKNLNKYSLDNYDSYKHVITACSRLPYNKVSYLTLVLILVQQIDTVPVGLICLLFFMQWIETVPDQVGDLIVKSLLATREAFLQIRHFLREMGKNAGVPVSLSVFFFLKMWAVTTKPYIINESLNYNLVASSSTVQHISDLLNEKKLAATGLNQTPLSKIKNYNLHPEFGTELTVQSDWLPVGINAPLAPLPPLEPYQ